MKAVVYETYGPPGVLRVAELEQPFGCAQLRLGAHAEYVSLPATFTIVPKPENMSFVEAAAVPLGGLNALHFTTTDKTAVYAFAGETSEELLVLKEMIENGEIKAEIDGVYPYERAAEAHRRVEAEQRVGCVVLSAG